MRSILADLEKAHNICVAMQSCDPAVIAGREEEATFRAALVDATADLDTCLRIASRNNKSHARSDSTTDDVSSGIEPHQASVESGEPHPTTTNG